MNFIHRNITPPKDSFFLFGPRGTGKSTWLLNTYKDALRIDLLDRQIERKLIAKPEELINLIAALKENSVCIIDEIQKIPNLIPVIHSIIESKKNIQFILTGSSSRKLKRSLGDLLGGRALLRQMHPFVASELKDDFSLENALQFGLIPMVMQSNDPGEKLRAYVSIYLKEEVQAEGLVRQIGDFARFMEIASFSHANLWSSTEISRESHVKRQTVDNYLQILEDLLIAFTLPVFTRRAKRSLISHSKFYYFDVGIFRELRPKGPLDEKTEIEGPALEGLVAQHLRSWISSQKETHQLYFWRTRAKVEVDFVIYGPRGFWGIEVKRSQNLSIKDIKGLKAFKDEYPEAEVFLLYSGKEKLKMRDILCLPVEDFLLQLSPNKLIL